MITRILAFSFLLFLLGQSSSAQSYVEKYRHRMRVMQRSERGSYELCTPVDGPGFCIRGCGEKQDVLLGYSPEGDLQKALEDSCFCSFLKSYEKSMAEGREEMSQPSRILPERIPNEVPPLLTDVWDQYAPYNICAPMLEGKHCLVGCVALAMAQVMHYWRWPEIGRGTHAYIDSTGCQQALTADFAHVYDWGKMCDAYQEDADSSDLNLLAAGRLLRDCGVAVDMRYGLDASAARTVRQPQALFNYFCYDEGMQLLFRDFYTRTEWEETLLTELASGRPVLFAAHSSTLSHAMVCDGYDSQGLFHLNFGMGGYTDGYYYLPFLTPKQPEWYDPDNPEGGMNLLQSMVIGVQPASSAPQVRHTFGMSAIVPVCDSSIRGGKLSVVTCQMANVGWNEAKEGSVQLLLLNEDKVVRSLAQYPHTFALEELTDSTYTDTLLFSVPESIPTGLYCIQPAVKEPDGEWTFVRTSVGTPSRLLLQVTSDSLLLTTDNLSQASLELLSWQFPDSIPRFQRPEFSFRLRNSGSSEYCGRFSVLFRDTNCPNQYRVLQRQGLWLSPGEETERTFRRTFASMPEGDYELCLAYDCNLFSDSLVWIAPDPLQRVHIGSPVPSSVQRPSEASGETRLSYGIDGRRLSKWQAGIRVEKKRNKYRKIIVK